ncbi:MAG TPA: hypothetical protein PKY81_08935 [bacterium]|nr:hypothetical protein [bacterium]HPN31069.1 hypothetical protein [bacterium]
MNFIVYQKFIRNSFNIKDNDSKKIMLRLIILFILFVFVRTALA